jgi:hypothetical protein
VHDEGPVAAAPVRAEHERFLQRGSKQAPGSGLRLARAAHSTPLLKKARAGVSLGQCGRGAVRCEEDSCLHPAEAEGAHLPVPAAGKHEHEAVPALPACELAVVILVGGQQCEQGERLAVAVKPTTTNTALRTAHRPGLAGGRSRAPRARLASRPSTCLRRMGEPGGG